MLRSQYFVEQSILFGLISTIGGVTLVAIATIYGVSWLILSAAKLGGYEDEP